MSLLRLHFGEVELQWGDRDHHQRRFIWRCKITFTSTLSFDEVSERIPMQNTWGQGRGGVYGNKSRILGRLYSDRAGGADTFNTSGGFFTVRKQVLFTTL